MDADFIGRERSHIRVRAIGEGFLHVVSGRHACEGLDFRAGQFEVRALSAAWVRGEEVAVASEHHQLLLILRDFCREGQDGAAIHDLHNQRHGRPSR